MLSRKEEVVYEKFQIGQDDPILTETFCDKKLLEVNSINSILTERGSRYGSFEGHANVTQSIKHSMRNSDKWNMLDDDMTEALEMIAHKIGRILNGDPEYLDSWVDIVGYTQLVINRLEHDKGKALKSANIKRT